MKEPWLAQCRKRKASSEMDALRKVRCDWDDLGASGVVDSNLGFEGEGSHVRLERSMFPGSRHPNAAQTVLRSRDRCLLPPTASSSRREDLHRGGWHLSLSHHTELTFCLPGQQGIPSTASLFTLVLVSRPLRALEARGLLSCTLTSLMLCRGPKE